MQHVLENVNVMNVLKDSEDLLKSYSLSIDSINFDGVSLGQYIFDRDNTLVIHYFLEVQQGSIALLFPDELMSVEDSGLSQIFDLLNDEYLLHVRFDIPLDGGIEARKLCAFNAICGSSVISNYAGNPSAKLEPGDWCSHLDNNISEEKEVIRAYYQRSTEVSSNLRNEEFVNVLLNIFWSKYTHPGRLIIYEILHKKQ